MNTKLALSAIVAALMLTACAKHEAAGIQRPGRALAERGQMRTKGLVQLFRRTGFEVGHSLVSHQPQALASCRTGQTVRNPRHFPIVPGLL